jgi:multiple sugar transport system permease protein
MSIQDPLANVVEHPRIAEFQNSLYEFLSNKWVLVIITIVPAALLFTFVNLLPIVWAVIGGFFEISAFSPVWTWNGIENYVTTLQSPQFWASLRRSVVFAGGSVIIQLIFGTAIALVINRDFKFASLFRAIAMLPYLIPTAVLGFVALWMANSQFGIINQILVRLGLIESSIAWYGNPELAMLAVIITSSWKFSIFITIMVLARLQSIPDGYYEAATVAGATWYQKFRDITLPNLKGVLFIVILLRGVWMFNKFDIIYVLTQGGPVNKTTTSAIYAYRTAFVSLELGRAAAVSTLLFIFLGVSALIYFYTFDPSKEVRVE